MKKLIKILVLWCMVSTIAATPLQEAFNLTLAKNIYATEAVFDEQQIPQNGAALLADPEISPQAPNSFKAYYQHYFQPWIMSIEFNPTLLFKQISKRPVRYSATYQRLPHAWFDQLAQNANVGDIGKINLRAIVVNNTALRALPTYEPAFGDPSKAGEGYPFDMLQDDYLRVGEPIVVSHFSQDQQFAYIAANGKARGFVAVRDIAYVDDVFIKKFYKKLAMIKTDRLQIHQDINTKVPAMTLYLGTVLPVTTVDKKNYIFIPIKKYNGQAVLVRTPISRDAVIRRPMSLNKRNVVKIVELLINQPYGWGGHLFQRDCVRLVKDYFSVFGVYLPLYSKEQAKMGRAIDLSGLGNDQKIKTLLEQAKPYQSVVYFPGHVAIYMGECNKQPLFFHAVWGLKLFDQQNREYRYVIGKSLLSTMSLGKELPGWNSVKSDLMPRVSALVDFFE